jgi:hypothetical protein
MKEGFSRGLTQMSADQNECNKFQFSFHIGVHPRLILISLCLCEKSIVNSGNEPFFIRQIAIYPAKNFVA